MRDRLINRESRQNPANEKPEAPRIASCHVGHGECVHAHVQRLWSVSLPAFSSIVADPILIYQTVS